AVDLQRDEHSKDEQEPGLRGEDHDAKDHETAEYIDRTAYARIEAGCYQNGGFGLNAECAAELESGNNEEQQRRERDRHSGDVRGSPWNAASMRGKHDGSNKDQCERDEVELHVDGLHMLSAQRSMRCLCSPGIVCFTDVSILHCGRGVRQAIRRSPSLRPGERESAR